MRPCGKKAYSAHRAAVEREPAQSRSLPSRLIRSTSRKAANAANSSPGRPSRPAVPGLTNPKGAGSPGAPSLAGWGSSGSAPQLALPLIRVAQRPRVSRSAALRGRHGWRDATARSSPMPEGRLIEGLPMMGRIRSGGLALGEPDGGLAHDGRDLSGALAWGGLPAKQMTSKEPRGAAPPAWPHVPCPAGHRMGEQCPHVLSQLFLGLERGMGVTLCHVPGCSMGVPSRKTLWHRQLAHWTAAHAGKVHPWCCDLGTPKAGALSSLWTRWER